MWQTRQSYAAAGRRGVRRKGEAVGSTFAVFAEGRASVSFQLTETKGNFGSSGDVGVEKSRGDYGHWGHPHPVLGGAGSPRKPSDKRGGTDI